MSPVKTVTYSSAYTIVPTYECFNHCTYCNFRTEPGKSTWLTTVEARSILEKLQGSEICEILILSGEVHPNSPRRKAWFKNLYTLGKLAYSCGFLPHTNAGPLSYKEMTQLKEVNVSMGLMLEQVTPRLLQTVHRHAPSKNPALRRQQLEWAGELQIPFTTGLLLGLGETPADWWDTLEAIAQIHERWKHIQEVILQPYSPGSQERYQAPGFDLAQLPTVVSKARKILPAEIVIQIPPNLVSQPNLLLDCLAAGAKDLGGIGPKDEVNPDYPHPLVQSLAAILEPAGWKLEHRLPVYPQFDHWLPNEMQVALAKWKYPKH